MPNEQLSFEPKPEIPEPKGHRLVDPELLEREIEDREKNSTYRDTTGAPGYDGRLSPYKRLEPKKFKPVPRRAAEDGDRVPVERITDRVPGQLTEEQIKLNESWINKLRQKPKRSKE